MTYIGYYIEFVEHETISTEYEETRCINSDCPNHHQEVKETVKFCPECGSKVEWQDVTVTKPKDVNDYIEECEIGDSLDTFNAPDYIDRCLVDRYKELDMKPHSNIIVINSSLIPCKGTRDEFVNHPAVKELIGKLGVCDIHFGLVQYQL